MQIRTIELESDADPKAVGAELARLGQWLSPQKDQDGLIRSFIVDPSSCAVELKLVESIAGVKRALGGVSPHPLVDRLAHRHLSVGGASFGETRPWRADALHRQTAPLLIAGPCSFESEQVVHEVAQLVASAGGKWLRGGAYKPRTSPYSFQGEGAKALLDLPRRWKIPGGGFPTATSGPSHCAGSIALHRNYGSAATNRWAHRSSPSSVVEKPLSQDFDGPSKSPLNCRGAVSGWSVVWHSVSMRRLSRERCSDVRRESDRRCRI